MRKLQKSFRLKIYIRVFFIRYQCGSLIYPFHIYYSVFFGCRSWFPRYRDQRNMPSKNFLWKVIKTAIFRFLASGLNVDVMDLLLKLTLSILQKLERWRNLMQRTDRLRALTLQPLFLKCNFKCISLCVVYFEANLRSTI